MLHYRGTTTYARIIGTYGNSENNISSVETVSRTGRASVYVRNDNDNNNDNINKYE